MTVRQTDDNSWLKFLDFISDYNCKAVKGFQDGQVACGQVIVLKYMENQDQQNIDFPIYRHKKEAEHHVWSYNLKNFIYWC